MRWLACLCRLSRRADLRRGLEKRSVRWAKLHAQNVPRTWRELRSGGRRLRQQARLWLVRRAGNVRRRGEARNLWVGRPSLKLTAARQRDALEQLTQLVEFRGSPLRAHQLRQLLKS